MGDGRRYQGSTVSHIYWRPGDYVLTVTAENAYGESRYSQWVRVQAGTLYYYLPFLDNGGSTAIAAGVVSIDGDASGAINIGLGPFPELLPIDFHPGTAEAEQLLVYINEARRLYNLRPLALVHSLSVAAQAHTDDMAAYRYTGHTGSDGSSPAYRLHLAGYEGGYGGEATAWGMSDAIDPVRFWLTSPGHRAILLNRAVSEVGVGYTVDYNAPNVWYWTAEFASLELPVVGASPPPVQEEPEHVADLILLGPPQSSEFILSDDANLIFSWSWTGGLQSNQRFAIYIGSGGRIFQLGVIRQTQPSGQYQFTVNVSDIAIAPGLYHWQVKLEDSGQGAVVAESSVWDVHFSEPHEVTLEPTPISTPSGTVPPEPSPTSPPGTDPPPIQTPLPIATPVPTSAP
jgi:hypothetical protein